MDAFLADWPLFSSFPKSQLPQCKLLLIINNYSPILQSLMSKYKVEGFPTILVFGADKESPFPYQGARAASAIESFALEQLEANSGPAEVSELTGPVRLWYIQKSDGRLVHHWYLKWRFGFCRMSWKRSVLLLPFVLYHSFQISLTQRQKEETSTLSSCSLLLKSLKRVHTGKCFFFPENFGRSSAFQYRPYQNVSSSSHSKKGKTSRV